MGSDVTLSHTIDDDITFERVRHMPKRTHFVSTHRKLSWQYDREMKQHERDKRVSHMEMSRAKTAMAEKFGRLQNAKREMDSRKSVSAEGGRGAGDLNRDSVSMSSPCLPETIRSQQAESSNPVSAMKHSQSASCFPHTSTIPEDTAVSETATFEAASSKVHTVMAAKPSDAQPARSGRRATIVEGVREEGSKLPAHLARRFSQFMDSTSGLLMSVQNDWMNRSGSRTRRESEKKDTEDEDDESMSQSVSDVQNQSIPENETFE
ncbi:uncharacterized protein [Littorina saxatilis]|uniref:Uncharacterized protein n=1 Tax=Littorina saxatilis TaxID=31220 RepID=A0AAN9B9D8_9CAEN